MILAESKYKKRVERMRERTLQHVGIIHNLKDALAESASQTSQAQTLHQECVNRLEAAKIRIEALEGEIALSETQNTKNHAQLLDTRSIISELRAQVLEKDRQLDRDSILIGQLQIQVQDIKAACSELEREVRSAKEEKEHSRAMIEAELNRATESASRARELQRHAERDLLAAKHRVEEALTEGSERLAETQRVHNKEIAALRAEIDELKNALAAERMAVNNVAEQASLKSSRDLAEARNASAQFIFRLESQLASAIGKAERFERLYQQQLSNSKDIIALEVKYAYATSDRNDLIEKLRNADENLRQFELRALSAEGELEILRRRLETTESDLHRVVLVGAGSEERRDSEHRGLVRAMDQVSLMIYA
jgi:chromosome segregation ATPase